MPTPRRPCRSWPRPSSWSPTASSATGAPSAARWPTPIPPVSSRPCSALLDGSVDGPVGPPRAPDTMAGGRAVRRRRSMSSLGRGRARSCRRRFPIPPAGDRQDGLPSRWPDVTATTPCAGVCGGRRPLVGPDGSSRSRPSPSYISMASTPVVLDLTADPSADDRSSAAVDRGELYDEVTAQARPAPVTSTPRPTTGATSPGSSRAGRSRRPSPPVRRPTPTGARPHESTNRGTR